MEQVSLFGNFKKNDSVNYVGDYKGNYLFFDTETTGFPKNWLAPTSDFDNWPRLVQIAWVFYKDGFCVQEKSFIIKPNNFLIPSESSKVHGITNEIAQQQGVELGQVLIEFVNLLETSNFLVAHNMSFDKNVIESEFLRNKMQNYFENKKMICTKEISTNFCAIPSNNGYKEYKWPKLSELYYKLFNKDILNAHDALVDVTATAKCFWEMKNRKVI